MLDTVSSVIARVSWFSNILHLHLFPSRSYSTSLPIPPTRQCAHLRARVFSFVVSMQVMKNPAFHETFPPNLGEAYYMYLENEGNPQKFKDILSQGSNAHKIAVDSQVCGCRHALHASSDLIPTSRCLVGAGGGNLATGSPA